VPGATTRAAEHPHRHRLVESVAFATHDERRRTSIDHRRGNTAMDCCRSSLASRCKDIKVMARRPRETSRPPLELEEREEENVEIVVQPHSKHSSSRTAKLVA